MGIVPKVEVASWSNSSSSIRWDEVFMPDHGMVVRRSAFHDCGPGLFDRPVLKLNCCNVEVVREKHGVPQSVQMHRQSPCGQMRPSGTLSLNQLPRQQSRLGAANSVRSTTSMFRKRESLKASDSG